MKKKNVYQTMVNIFIIKFIHFVNQYFVQVTVHMHTPNLYMYYIYTNMEIKTKYMYTANKKKSRKKDKKVINLRNCVVICLFCFCVYN